MDFIAVIIGLLLLIKGGDWLLKSSVALSLNLSIPKAVIGMTVVSFATSAPELIVSVRAALLDHPEIALGNAVGSNIANLSLVLGVTVIIAPIAVPRSFFRTDWPMMMFSTVLLIAMIVFDHTLSTFDGAILFSLMIGFIIYLLRTKKIKEEAVEDVSGEFEPLTNLQTLKYFLLGGFFLWLGSETLIKGAVSLASIMGVSKRIISISIISIGTSIPELSASIVAVVKKEKAISLGNLIGSNVFNILSVLGFTAMIQCITISEMDLFFTDLIWMFAISALILVLAKLSRSHSINRLSGILLLGLYAYFIYSLVE